MNSKDDLLEQLSQLGLNPEESRVYLELLQGPRTHLQVSKETGVNRTKVYRIVEDLQQRSLVGRRVDDRGTFLVATDPSALEVSLISEEERLKQQRKTLSSLLPTLTKLQGKDMHDFAVRTYDGTAGLKQMCWHELKAKSELLALGNGTIEQIASDEKWAMKHRQRQIEAGYITRELVNYDYLTSDLPELASRQLIESKLYRMRVLAPSVLSIDNQTTIYNDTVAIYHWKQEKKVGIEIISATYAQMMRQMFEHYWNVA